VEKLNSDPELKKAKVLAHDGGETTITFQPLDISAQASIHKFRDFLRKEHPDEIDILINNAGIAMDGFGEFLQFSSVWIVKDSSKQDPDDNVVEETLKTNYYGSLEMTQEILPMIRPGGRLVNVCSMAGRLSRYPSPLKEAFISASQTSVSACTELMVKFASDVKGGKETQDGWPRAAYAISKAGEIAATKVIAMEEEMSGKGVLINACCPGYVNTDMSKGKGTKTVDEGAKTPVLLALGEIRGKTGGFWQSEGIVEW
jgi:carbonyl reductase 1